MPKDINKKDARTIKVLRQFGSHVVYYARDNVSCVRIMQALEGTEDGGVTGRQYIFDGTGVYRVIALALTSRELEQPDL
jgi:hypothetical protein